MNSFSKQQCPTPQALTPLLRLPTELDLIIASYVQSYTHPDNVQRLIDTNRCFHHIIPPPFRTTLIRLQQFPYIQESHCDFGSCKLCRISQLRPQKLCKDCWEKVLGAWNRGKDERLAREKEEEQESLRVESERWAALARLPGAVGDGRMYYLNNWGA
jgi:hypothetical protein